MIKKVILSALLLSTIQLSAQVVGSRENSDLSPTNVSPSQLSGGGFAGDVNVFNGSYSASHPLGAVSTPGGLSYALNLNYSASYGAGASPSVCSGIPYGEGWNVNIPMITVSNTSYFSFLATYECSVKGAVVKDTNNYYLEDVNINGVNQPSRRVQGDLFWFSPQISIPGVTSGRAVFKYIDDDDSDCAVFVLNKFERYVEIRFYGSFWAVYVDNGDRYYFSTSLVTYRSPNNQRVLEYDTYSQLPKDEVEDIITDSDYGTLKEAVLNVVEPKQAYTSWYCNTISNKNLPGQTINFDYEKFGAFNYFQEFEQPLLAAKMSDKLRDLGSFTPDYEAYTDILLTKITSYAVNTPVEILDLGYATSELIGTKMLDPNDSGVERLDSLYAYETVYSEGLGTDEFVDWNRYYHGKSDGGYAIAPGADPGINPRNPYITTSGNGTAGDAYLRDTVGDRQTIPFDHSFLESPRILGDGVDLVPGDVYEVRTKVADNNGSDPAMGTGTLDISIVTGDLNYNPEGYDCSDLTPPYDSCTYNAGSVDTYGSLNNSPSDVYPTADYYQTRRTNIFTTQNQAIKWHLPVDQTSLNTSNFFVMPNVPSHCDGMNIQVGPGNSDTDYGQSTFYGVIGIGDSVPDRPSAYNAYWHNLNDVGASYEDVSYNFGIGMPWSMGGTIVRR